MLDYLMNAVAISVAFLIPYLLGSIPFGLILVKIFVKKDIRSVSSGNIGATNVVRAGGKALGGVTLVLDAFKAGLMPAWVMLVCPAGADMGYRVAACIASIIGLSSMLGHVFPVWLRFRGGKGVAPYCGVLVALSPWAGVFFVCVWISVFLRTRISSLSALVGICAVLPVPLAKDMIEQYLDEDYLTTIDSTWIPVTLFCFCATLLLFYTHRANIARLRAGTEPKFAAKA